MKPQVSAHDFLFPCLFVRFQQSGGCRPDAPEGRAGAVKATREGCPPLVKASACQFALPRFHLGRCGVYPPLYGVFASVLTRRVTLIASNVRCLLHRIAPVEWHRRPWGRIVAADSRARAMLSIWRCRLCRRSLKPSSPWRRWARSSSRFSIHTRSSSGFGGARGLCATERSSARNGVKNKAGVAARPLQVEIRIARVIG